MSTLWRVILRPPLGEPEAVELRAPSPGLAQAMAECQRPGWTIESTEPRPTIDGDRGRCPTCGRR